MAQLEQFLKDGKWACNQCGACCSFVRPLFKKYPQYKKWVMWDGSCVHLGKDKKCKIYETRPDVCRVYITLRGYTDEQKAEMCKEMADYEEGRR